MVYIIPFTYMYAMDGVRKLVRYTYIHTHSRLRNAHRVVGSCNYFRHVLGYVMGSWTGWRGRDGCECMVIYVMNRPLPNYANLYLNVLHVHVHEACMCSPEL